MDLGQADEVRRIEVHARCQNGQMLFRIWNGHEDKYAGAETADERAITALLVKTEVKKFREMIKAGAISRINNAKMNGFEAVFISRDELDMPWHQEEKRLLRSSL